MARSRSPFGVRSDHRLSPYGGRSTWSAVESSLAAVQLTAAEGAAGATEWSAPVGVVCWVVSHPLRCHLLVALTRHEWVPVALLHRALRTSAAAMSQQLAYLRKLKLVEVGVGRLYRLHPALRPPPGQDYLDLGWVRLPFHPDWTQGPAGPDALARATGSGPGSPAARPAPGN